MNSEGGRGKNIDVLKVHGVNNEKQANRNDITPSTHPHMHTRTHTDTHTCTNPEAVDSAVFHSL